jgi:hypothetical protein
MLTLALTVLPILDGSRNAPWPAVVAAATASRSPVAVADLNKPGAPKPSPAEVRVISAVLGVSTPAERRQLMVAHLNDGVDEMVLYFGDPQRPDGIMPDRSETSYHVLGSCNEFYNPRSDYTFPGTPGCDPQLAADRVVIRMRHERARGQRTPSP